MMNQAVDGSADLQMKLPMDAVGLIQGTAIVNTYGVLADDGEFGATQLELSVNTPAVALGLVPNDLLMIIQMQGALINTLNSSSYGTVTATNRTGRFEFIGVKSVDPNGTTVYLYDSCGGLQNSYSAATSQVIRVPQYSSLAIEQTATLTGQAWNGQTGGVIAVRVDGTVTIDGQIQASGLGFRGGALNSVTDGRIPNFGDFYLSYNADDGGNKGESIVGYSDTYALTGAYGRGAPANGGGGGNRILAGGGGGANGDNGQPWSGQGVMPAAQATDFALDPGYIANGSKLTNSSGGGRGGYTYSEQNLNPQTVAPGDPTWGGDLRRERGGLGGHPNTNDPTTRLSMGGGGGAGDVYTGGGGAGGSGGGLVFLIAGAVSGAGSINALGNNGVANTTPIGGGGGGGGGGTVVIAAASVGGIRIQASGGTGGQSGATTGQGNPAAGPGGGGGGGYIAVPSGSLATTTYSGGSSGRSTSIPTNTNAVANGSTFGATGRLATTANAPFGGAPFCTTADLAVTLTGPSTPTSRRSPVAFTINVVNNGPSPAANVLVTLSLPASGEFDQVQAPGWNCTSQGSLLSCTQLTLAASASSVIMVNAKPPLSVTAALATAQVSQQGVDPILSNNTSEASVNITDPLNAYGEGGGVVCQAGGAGQRATQGTVPLWCLFTVGLALHLRRRSAARRRSS